MKKDEKEFLTLTFTKQEIRSMVNFMNISFTGGGGFVDEVHKIIAPKIKTAIEELKKERGNGNGPL